jgi:shikimate dehydrogenase
MSTVGLVLGLLGEHIENSLSPLIHMNFIRYYSLNYSYLPFQIKSNNLKKAIIGAKALGIKGLNVTIPYKEEAMKLMDEVAPVARDIGAINTIVYQNEKLSGYNTDCNGFKIPLKEGLNINLSGKRAMVLGAGGAARAVICALADEGCSVISIFNRTQERAMEIKRQYEKNLHQCEIRSLPFYTNNLQKEILETDLLINTTPLGSWYYPDQDPLPEGINIHPDTIIYDLIYCPDKTPLLQRAEMNGNKILNGLQMLVYQAAESFYLWTGIYPEREIINQTIRKIKQKEKL